MKLISVVCFLAVLWSNEASVVKAPSARSNLIIGNIIAGDRLLASQYLYKSPVPNVIQSQDLIYRGNFTTRITAIRAMEQGYTQYGTAWVIAGGVGWSNVTVRVQSYRGYGYYYLIDVWGR